MLIYVDIDGTICENRDTLRKKYNRKDIHYRDVFPFEDRIAKVNELYDQGHTIVYWTARGVSSGDDYTELTNFQLQKWGCKYHELKMNQKPHFDIYICDKSHNADVYFQQLIEGEE